MGRNGDAVSFQVRDPGGDPRPPRWSRVPSRGAAARRAVLQGARQTLTNDGCVADCVPAVEAAPTNCTKLVDAVRSLSAAAEDKLLPRFLTGPYCTADRPISKARAHLATLVAATGGQAELEAKDPKCRTALALAEARGYKETARLLRERGAAPAAAKAAPARTPRQAAEAGLRQVEHSMEVFAKCTGCISCHHEGIARYATGFAHARGYSIDAAFAKEQE